MKFLGCSQRLNTDTFKFVLKVREQAEIYEYIPYSIAVIPNRWLLAIFQVVCETRHRRLNKYAYKIF